MKSIQALALLVLGLSSFTEVNAKHMKANHLRGGQDKSQLTQESLILDTHLQRQHQAQVEEDKQECSEPLRCADPVTDPNYTGPCPSRNCDNSKCKFRGCVHYGAFGPQWMPDPCTICSCRLSKEFCSKIECEEKLECFGFPTMVKEGECCPSCDLRVAQSECGVIPTRYKSLYIALGDKNCQKDVLLHGCNKEFIAGKDGRFYQCTPESMVHTVEIGADCKAGIQNVTYKDIGRCTKKEISPRELPQDLDFEPRRCAYKIDPQSSTA